MRFSDDQEESSSLEKLFGDWCEEVADDGLDSCQSVGRAGRGHCATRKIVGEKADKQESVSLSLLKATDLEVDHHGPDFSGGRRVDGQMEKGVAESVVFGL